MSGIGAPDWWSGAARSGAVLAGVGAGLLAALATFLALAGGLHDPWPAVAGALGAGLGGGGGAWLGAARSDDV